MDGRPVIDAQTNPTQAWTEQMDDAVAEVFELMLCRSCAATQQTPPPHADISARIDFSGALEAQCFIEFPAISAQMLTVAFLGSGEADWDDCMVEDAIGELCNMIAGGWKKRFGASAWGADLSVPCISRASHRDTPDARAARIRRTYAFDEFPFTISLTILQAATPLEPSAT